MGNRISKLVRMTGAVCFFTIIALGASAVPAAAQSAEEAACRAAVAKSVGKYVKSVAKVVEKCNKDRSKGKVALSVNCNDVAEADTKNKLDKQRDSLRDQVAEKCAAAGSLIGAAYHRCPSPAAEVDDGDATTGIDTFAELSECMIANVDRLISQTAVESIPKFASKPGTFDAKCQGEIGKNVRKVLQTIAKERAKCQRASDRNGAGLEYSCGSYDEKGKIEKTIDKAKTKVSASCTFSDPNPSTLTHERLVGYKTCGDTLANLLECVFDRGVGLLGGGLIGMAYSLPATCQAGSAIRVYNSGVDTQGQSTPTFLSTGWSGSAHKVDIVGRGNEPLKLLCDDDCSDCQVRFNPSATALPSPVCRCDNDSKVACDTLNGADVDDCGSVNNNCSCYYGAPLSLASGSNPVCVLNRVREQYSGSVDLGVGSYTNQIVPLNSAVFLGVDNFAPCPLCQGDSIPNDGVRTGTCSAGLAQGTLCDQNGHHPTFGKVSYDCPPDSVGNISGGGLVLSLPLSSDEVTMEATLPCDTPGDLCACRVCSGNSQVGCNSNADCDAIGGGAGTCTDGGGAGVEKNACEGPSFACGPDDRCVDGPTNSYCDGIVRANGRGFLGCNIDSECASQGAGSCSLQEKQFCYNYPLTTTGVPSRENPIIGAPFCIPPTTSIAINETAGLPGPGVFTVEYDTAVYCGADPSQAWQAPAGANCPPFTPSTTTTTTLIPEVLCEDSTAPTCGGSCPVGDLCVNSAGSCVCQSSLSCGGLFPACGGSCPVNSSCQGSTLGEPCSCQ